MPLHGAATFLLASALLTAGVALAQDEPTYAERLGWPKGAKVVIFHVDDSGMCHDANVGAAEALEGLATSTSVMMPCGWVPEMVRYAKGRPEADIGVHLTLTSEWKEYRWGPVAGKPAVPGLVDKEGCLWDDVPLVMAHATADEVETEIRAQVDRALTMGLVPTHIDSHMGTLFTPTFFPRYVKVGIEMDLPLLIPGGHMQFLGASSLAALLGAQIRGVARQVWDAGLPVVDDILTDTARWRAEGNKAAQLMAALGEMQPGITEVILHCTRPSETFKHISSSGPTRLDELEAMLDPKLERFIENEGILLTTWREMKQRRDALGAQSNR